MITSDKAFLIELYEEYLEEASFLYGQRLALLGDSNIAWKRVGEFENRFEAYIDGLVVGENLALEICQRKTTEGDSGELHAATRVFCRHDRKDLFLKLLDGLDAEDAPSVQAVADALKYELPESWQPEILSFLGSRSPLQVLIAIEVSGYRRLRASRQLTRLLETSSPRLLPRVIWALGRLAEHEARTAIFCHLLDGDQQTRSEAALALLRFGDESALRYCLQHAGSEQWPVLPLALGGGRNALEVLLHLTAMGKASRECLGGLGVLGYTAAVPALIDCLANDATASIAANSLDRITGAQLREEVFIPDDVDEEELFDQERGQLNHDQVAGGSSGRLFGTTVNRISQNPEQWGQWWDGRGSSMDPLLRFRNGELYSPESLLNDLQRETTPNESRRLTCEELIIRYRFDIPFDADMLVTQQINALATVKERARQQTSHFRSGRTYFAGRLVCD
jgi:uncharacterized protein (TIGR02270 family)